jgi:hypothetical protein
MVERYNKNANPLKLSVGDYVYMLTEQTGQGRKFQPKYTNQVSYSTRGGGLFRTALCV